MDDDVIVISALLLVKFEMGLLCIAYVRLQTPEQ